MFSQFCFGLFLVTSSHTERIGHRSYGLVRGRNDRNALLFSRPTSQSKNITENAELKLRKKITKTLVAGSIAASGIGIYRLLDLFFFTPFKTRKLLNSNLQNITEVLGEYVEVNVDRNLDRHGNVNKKVYGRIYSNIYRSIFKRKKLVKSRDALGGRVIALYFNGMGIEDVLKKHNFTIGEHILTDIYGEMKKQNQNFEMVYIPLDKKDRDSKIHSSSYPWASLPLSEKWRIPALLKATKLKAVPGVVIVDAKGNLINSKGFQSMLADPSAYPWLPPKLKDLIGEELITTSNEKIPTSDVLPNNIIALLFSANWCNPCHEFTETFSQIFQKIKKKGKRESGSYICI